MTIKTTSNRWITIPYPKPNAKIRLFCFPYAGGGASIYRLWGHDFPEDIEVCLVQLPGRETRINETSYTDIHQLVSDSAQEIIPFLDRPFVIFGYSMGAVIGYELTKHLEEFYNYSPIHLIVAAASAPHFVKKRELIHSLPDKKFINQLRQLNGTAEEILSNDELMQWLLPMIRADFQMVETYKCSGIVPLNCHLSVLGGNNDKWAVKESLFQWEDIPSKSFSVHFFEGDHFFLRNFEDDIKNLMIQKLLKS